MIDGLKLFTFLSIVNKDTNYGEVLEFQHYLGNKKSLRVCISGDLLDLFEQQDRGDDL